MELAGKEVLVIGLGLTGRSAAAFCAARGARVTAVDERPASALSSGVDLGPAVDVRFGTAIPDVSSFDLVVPSPGVPYERYASPHTPAWGDIELAGRALPIPIVAVTGTNGKSTCVRLLESMLRSAGLRAQAAGNVGTPALSLVGEPLDVAVLEVSSFQLESVDAFRPKVAVLLNLTPDHLDRHGDLGQYAAMKARLLRRQQGDDVAVLNADDPRVWSMAEVCRGRVIPFSRMRALAPGVYADSGVAVVVGEEETVRIPLQAPGLPGPHNLENILACLAAVSALGGDVARAGRALVAFRGLPHRCETVARIGGVTYVNDSKATNPGAARRSLESFDGAVWWIAGGRDKDLDFAGLGETAASRAHGALLIGEAATHLAEELEGHVRVEQCGDLASAVRRAHSLAVAGDTVLLSPACASFDQFENFEERGRRFAEVVQEIAENG